MRFLGWATWGHSGQGKKPPSGTVETVAVQGRPVIRHHAGFTPTEILGNLAARSVIRRHAAPDHFAFGYGDTTLKHGDADRILAERQSRDTFENAMFSRQIANPRPGELWLLVTSAAHMPRAMAAFRAANFPVDAYPVDFLTTGLPQDEAQPRIAPVRATERSGTTRRSGRPRRPLAAPLARRRRVVGKRHRAAAVPVQAEIRRFMPNRFRFPLATTHFLRAI